MLLKFHQIQPDLSFLWGERKEAGYPVLPTPQIQEPKSIFIHLTFWFGRRASVQATICSDCLGKSVLTRAVKDYNPLEVPNGSGTYKHSETITLIRSACSV